MRRWTLHRRLVDRNAKTRYSPKTLGSRTPLLLHLNKGNPYSGVQKASVKTLKSTNIPFWIKVD
jgi:hypothetical protein